MENMKSMSASLEAALASDDLAPVVKLVCATDFQRDSQHSKPSTLREIIDGSGVVRGLQSIANQRDDEIKRAVGAHSKDISAAARDLPAIKLSMADSRRRSQEIMSSLQRSYATYSERRDSLHKTFLASQRVHEAQAGIAAIRHIVSCLKEANDSMATGELYHALQLVNVVRAYLSGEEPDQSNSGPPVPSPHASNTLLQGRTPPKGVGTSVLSLIDQQIDIVESALDQRVGAELTQWLTQAREIAVRTGRKAVVSIEAQRQQRASLAEHRNCMLKALADGGVDAIARARNAATAALECKGSLATESHPAEALDMTRLLRCVHMAGALSSSSTILTYGGGHRHGLNRGGTAGWSVPILLQEYADNRRAQLGADLAPPGDLMACYQGFMWQILGFFIIEVQVLLLAPALGTREHAEVAWEGASAALSAELAAAIDESRRPEDILALKEYAVLVCDAIDEFCHGVLSTDGIRATLAARARRHLSALRDSVHAVLRSADRKEDEGFMTIELVQSLLEKCIAYRTGLGEQGMDASARGLLDCDTALAEAVATTANGVLDMDQGPEEEEADDASADSDAQSENDPVLDGLLALVASAGSLKAALDNVIEEKRTLGELSAGATCAQLEGALASVENSTGHRLAGALRPAVDAYAELDWTPDHMPRTAGDPSSQCAEILEVLRAVREVLACSAAPERSQAKVLAAALRSTAEGILHVLTSMDVPRYNVYGIQRLLTDARALVEFVKHEGVVHQEGTRDGKPPPCLADLVYFSEAVAFNSADAFLDPAGGAKFAEVNLDRVALLLEKLQDPPGGVASQLALSRKDAGRVARKLRDGLLRSNTVT